MHQWQVAADITPNMSCAELTDPMKSCARLGNSGTLSSPTTLLDMVAIELTDSGACKQAVLQIANAEPRQQLYCDS